MSKIPHINYLSEILEVSFLLGPLNGHQDSMYSWAVYKVQNCHNEAEKYVPRLKSEMEKLSAEEKIFLSECMRQIELKEITLTDYMKHVMSVKPYED